MGPKERRSTVLSPMEEAAIVALRVQARLPLDDVYIALKDVIPQLTRSSLHRCLQRHGISRLPKADREKPKKFKDYAIGYFHIDIAELRYEGGKGFLFVAVDRTSKLVFARIYRKASKLAASAFLNVLVRTVPYRIHTILTDNGVQFVDRYQGVSQNRYKSTSSAALARWAASSIASPIPIIHGPTARPSGWSEPSRKRPSNPSTTHQSRHCDDTSATGLSPTTLPSSSRL